MIPENFVEEWKKVGPWQSLSMVEQDLIISRALVELYNNPEIRNRLAFRGGIALNKLYINPPGRYSEDIDFVQISPEPIGSTITAIRTALDSWLGIPQRKLTQRSVKMIYQYVGIDNRKTKLKIEINTTEHFQVLGLKHIDYEANSEWFSGSSKITTYHLDELMATKLRALYQRRKGRDLFDLWLVLNRNLIQIDKVITIFKKYCEHNKQVITQEMFTQNLLDKYKHADFKIDMHLLLDPAIQWNLDEAFNMVQKHVIQEII